MTESLCPLVTVLLLLAPPTAETPDTPSTWRAAAEQYAQLDPSRQQQWTGDLLDRLDRANRLVLAPDEAAAQQARNAALLGQVAQGHTLAYLELLELLDQTDRREKDAVERLARQFRILVYDTFRLQRDEYSRRRATSTRALAAWQAAGSPFDRQHHLIDWLEAAILYSSPGSIAALPEVPNFELLPEIPQPLVLETPPEAIERPPPLPSTIPPEPVETPRPAPIPPEITPQPAGNLPPPDPVGLPATVSAAPQRLPAIDEAAAVPARTGQPPSRTIGAPQVVLPKVPDVPPPTSPPTDLPQQQPAGLPTQINLAELAARIAGANLALQTLEAELAEEHPWNAQQLEPLVARLAILVVRLDDLAVFHALISPQQQQRVGRPLSPQAAISRLAACIFEARAPASDPNSTGTEAQRRDELQRLDDLSRRLAGLASQK